MAKGRRLVLVSVEPAVRETRWRRFAACNGSPPEWFYPVENTPVVPSEVRKLCEACPVRANCLLEALVFRERGIWGGTNEGQRRALRRRYKRNTCPVCGPALIVPYHDRQACTSCGLSWIVARARNAAGLIPLHPSARREINA
jgi:WhiB family transcriptional regulator, redox-sensing transcriptional regulator